MPDWMDVLGTVAKVGVAMLGMAQFQTILKMERDVARQYITSKVENLAPQQLDEFEVEFLSYSVALFDGQQRIRAMELYAWLKLQEFAYYRKFRGFCTPGDPLS
jgi:hypothetical protein